MPSMRSEPPANRHGTQAAQRCSCGCISFRSPQLIELHKRMVAKGPSLVVALRVDPANEPAAETILHSSKTPPLPEVANETEPQHCDSDSNGNEKVDSAEDEARPVLNCGEGNVLLVRRQDPPLLRLPAELRLCIYDMVLEDVVREVTTAGRLVTRSPLRHTCKLIRAEYQPFLDSSTLDITATVIDLNFQSLLEPLQPHFTSYRGDGCLDATRARNQRVIVALHFTNLMCGRPPLELRDKVMRCIISAWRSWIAAASAAREQGMRFDYHVTADSVQGLCFDDAIWRFCLAMSRRPYSITYPDALADMEASRISAVLEDYAGNV